MARKRTGTLVYRATQGWCARVTVTVDGESTKEWIVLGTHNKQAARRKLAREVTKVAAGVQAEPAAEDTVTEYTAVWVKDRYAAGIAMARDEEKYLNAYVLPVIGPMGMSKVTPIDTLSVLKAARDKGLKKQSVKHIRGAMLRMFETWAFEVQTTAGILPSNPVSRVKMSKVEMKKEIKKERCILTNHEFRALVECHGVDLELRLLALVARIEGGMRTSDLHAWDWSMINRVHFETCTIYRSKTDDIQCSDLPPVVSEALRQKWGTRRKARGRPNLSVEARRQRGQTKARPGHYLCRSPARCPSPSRHCSPRCTRPATKRTKKGTEVPNPFMRHEEECCPNMVHDPLFAEMALTLPVDFHSFRRAFVSAGAAGGVNVQTMMRVAHHSDEKTHMGYAAKNSPEMRRIPNAAVPDLRLMSVEGGWGRR